MAGGWVRARPGWRLLAAAAPPAGEHALKQSGHAHVARPAGAQPMTAPHRLLDTHATATTTSSAIGCDRGVFQLVQSDCDLLTE